MRNPIRPNKLQCFVDIESVSLIKIKLRELTKIPKREIPISATADHVSSAIRLDSKSRLSQLTIFFGSFAGSSQFTQSIERLRQQSFLSSVEETPSIFSSKRIVFNRTSVALNCFHAFLIGGNLSFCWWTFCLLSGLFDVFGSMMLWSDVCAVKVLHKSDAEHNKKQASVEFPFYSNKPLLMMAMSPTLKTAALHHRHQHFSRMCDDDRLKFIYKTTFLVSQSSNCRQNMSCQ